MFKQCARAFTAMVLVLGAAGAAADPPAGFEQRVEQLRKAYGTPGVTVAIVENGKVTLARGWGVRDLATRQPVDADTIFFTGSTGKAFTTAALATLVDAGKIKWDDKVIDHMPDFRMWDPWVTREMTIRDLLVHRSGLGLGKAICFSSPTAICRARRRRGESVISNRQPAFAADMRTTTSSTWPRGSSSKRSAARRGSNMCASMCWRRSA